MSLARGGDGGGGDDGDWTATLPRRYRVVGELGVGAGSRVFLAGLMSEGGAFMRWCAIRRVAFDADERFARMFVDEARLASWVGHDNVALMIEIGEQDGAVWLATEYVHGEKLREVIRAIAGAPATEKMPLGLACRLVAEAADGLHAAHELVGRKGEKLELVHRSVTPRTLYVTFDGHARVTGFGISKLAGLDLRVRAGSLKGTLPYMSPEQVAGAVIDRRTDVFALGVVLWELVTGRSLFRREGDLDTLAALQECRPPAPSSVAFDCPPALDAIVMTALAKDPAARYPTAGAFGDALRGLGASFPPLDAEGYVARLLDDRLPLRNGQLHRAAMLLPAR